MAQISKYEEKVESVENQVLFEWITMSTPLRPRPRS